MELISKLFLWQKRLFDSYIRNKLEGVLWGEKRENFWAHLEINEACNGVKEVRYSWEKKYILEINKEKLVRWKVLKKDIQGWKPNQFWKKECKRDSILSHHMSKDTFILFSLDSFDEHKLLGWKLFSFITKRSYYWLPVFLRWERNQF